MSTGDDSYLIIKNLKAEVARLNALLGKVHHVAMTDPESENAIIDLTQPYKDSEQP
jgi:hypothetical protein